LKMKNSKKVPVVEKEAITIEKRVSTDSKTSHNKSHSSKKKKRSDSTFFPDQTVVTREDFLPLSSEDEELEPLANKSVHKKGKIRSHTASSSSKRREKQPGGYHTKTTKTNSIEELYKGQNGTFGSYVRLDHAGPRIRSKTKKLIQAEDDIAQRKQRSLEKKLAKKDDLALELVSFRDQIDYYIETIQAEINAIDIAVSYLPSDTTPSSEVYTSPFGKMKRNKELYGPENSDDVSDFSDSLVSSWTDSLLEESVEENEDENNK